MASSIFDAYLAGGVRELFAGDPTRAHDRKQAVVRALRPLDARVHAALVRQHEAYGESAARRRHLDELRHGAAAVVTGQQVGLFLGPLYTIYKAATAIVAARALREETGKPVVPVFWLQTEDHDLPEIASCALPGEGEARVIDVPVEAHNRVAVEHVPLPAQVADALAWLQSELGELPHAHPHLERLARHYRPGAGFASAFAHVLAELFEPEGLLIVDPRDPALAEPALPVHREALRSAVPIAHGLLARCEQLTRMGCEPAVHVRPDAPLCFLHPLGPEGPRFRLVPQGGELVEVGGERRYSLGSLLQRLEQEPLCFSTSALLRPIVQDTLLPTAAYVGGPGEIAYFAQLAPLYAHFERPMPLVLARARFTVVERKAERILERMHVSVAELRPAESAVLARLAAREHAASGALDAAQLEQKLLAGFEQVLEGALPEKSVHAAPLAASLARTRAALRRTARKLATSYGEALVHRDAARVRSVRVARALLWPGGAPQERVYGFPYFAARYGERVFLDAVLAAIEPFDATHAELRP